jgi:transposase
MTDPKTVAVGLDVHKSSVRLAVLRAGEVLAERTLVHDHAAVIAALAPWPGARVCQEAGPTGFGLHRALLVAGIESVIVAPGLVPSRPGDRVKTDKRDARRLAALHAAGLLTEIFVPTPEHEALRDLVRAREDGRLDRMRARHRLGKFVLRHDRRLPTTCWGPTRRTWLGRQIFELPGQQHAFDDYLFAVDQIDRRIEALERAIAELAADGPHAAVIGRLRCMRGIDTLTAVGLVAEAGDFNRFKTAEQFMSFCGLVPSERSSGESRRQGSITKAGSAHARRLLIEASWNSRQSSRGSWCSARSSVRRLVPQAALRAGTSSISLYV